MTFFRSFFAGLNPARSRRRVEARRAAKGARFAAIRSFQDLLKRAEETDAVQPPVKTPRDSYGRTYARHARKTFHQSARR